MRGMNILMEAKWNSDTSGKMVPGETISISVRSSHGHTPCLVLENMEKRPFRLLSEASLGNSVPEPKMKSPDSIHEREHSNVLGKGSEKESITIPMAMVRASGNGNFPTEKSTNTEGMRGMNIFMEAK